jgi:hypothetical protein
MSYDLKRSHFSIVLEKKVLAGSVITEEGVLLQSTIDAATGTEVVSPAVAAGTLLLAGFAIRDNADNATTSVVEAVTVPAAPGPYTVQLANNNVVATTAGDGSTASLRCALTASPFTELTLEDTGGGGGVATGEVGLEPATGILTFNSAQAGGAYTVTYRYNLTVAEARLKFYQRNINNEASTLFSQVGVGHGVGEIYTDQFDATVDWSTVTVVEAAGSVANGDAGTVTSGGAGTDLDARVISVPNVNNPLLGIAFVIGGNNS